MKRVLSCIVLVAVLLVTTSSTFARKWTDSTGKHSVEAELVEFKDGNVRLKKPNGTIITVPLNRLSEGDRNYLADLSKSKDMPGTNPKSDAKLTPDTEPTSNVGPRVILNEDRGEIAYLAFSPDGAIIAAAGAKSLGFSTDNHHFVTLWDVASRKKLHVLEHSSWVNAVAFGADRNVVATGSTIGNTDDDRKGVAILWNTRTGKEVHRFTETGSPVYALKISPNGKILATGYRSGKVILWNLAERKRIGTFQGTDDPIKRIAWSPDGKHLAVVNAGILFGKVRVWNLASGKEISLNLNDAALYDVAYSADGKMLVTGSIGGVTFWDATTFEKINNIWRVSRPHSLSPSADGKFWACVDEFDTIELLDTTRVLAETLKAEDNFSFKAVAFSPDGTLLASGSREGKINLWDARMVLPQSQP